MSAEVQAKGVLILQLKHDIFQFARNVLQLLEGEESVQKQQEVPGRSDQDQSSASDAAELGKALRKQRVGVPIKPVFDSKGYREGEDGDEYGSSLQ